jgi:hypothetical protein
MRKVPPENYDDARSPRATSRHAIAEGVGPYTMGLTQDAEYGGPRLLV